MACVVPSNTTILWESRIPVPRFMTTQAEIATSLKCENKGKMEHKEEHRSSETQHPGEVDSCCCN